MGKSKKDLPVLAADTFRHMYLFKVTRRRCSLPAGLGVPQRSILTLISSACGQNFKRIHRVETFHKFIDDVVNGKAPL